MRRGESGINCLIAVDKPLGMTSHDVVSRVRRMTGERRVGHAGTLDPDASGVLVVGIGQAARLLGMLTMDVKSYDARIEFGTETTTDDAEGEVVFRAVVPDELRDTTFAAAAVAGLVGDHDQMPPSFSAISIDGVRAYDRARRGEKVELQARRITICDASLRGLDPAGPVVWDCSFTVSKGTYIRSIARDLGRDLGSAAHLCGLRRTTSGSVSLAECITLERLAEASPAALREVCLDPAHALGMPVRVLTDAEFADATCGKLLKNTDTALGQDEQVALVHEGLLVGVWHRAGGRLRCDANFPAGVMGVHA